MLFVFFLYLCINNITGVFMRTTILFLTVISLSALLSCGSRHSSTSPAMAISDSALNVLYNRAIADSTSFDSLCAIQQRGIEYSSASGNARREYLFRALKTIYYAIHREQDKYVTEAHSLIDYYKTTDDEEHLYQAWFTLANNQLGWGDYNDAVDEAGKMSQYAQKTGSKQGKASSTLAFAECYEDNGQMKEAEKYYREAWILLPEVDDVGHTISTGFSLISICRANKRTAEAMSLSDRLPALIAKWEKKHDLLNPVYRLKYFLYRLNIYYDKKDRRMVTMRNDSVTYYNNMYADANQKVPVLYTHFRTCKINGDRARAMVYMDSVIQIKKQEGDNASLAGMYREKAELQDRKSTRLNSSHQIISYAVFCLKKKMRSIANYSLRIFRNQWAVLHILVIIPSLAVLIFRYIFMCDLFCLVLRLFFFFNDTATTEIYTLSLHDALPIFQFSNECAVKDGILYVNPDQVK